ncbi:MAG: formylglycine-generating enzyme family protein [Candidatus Latescibacteria bacterium]|jgi:iron(II)-dependent oxidoreductase|nr:formylglycine-generating enzyme family protein [Candidatus Latescibacterota bacterium]
MLAGIKRMLLFLLVVLCGLVTQTEAVEVVLKTGRIVRGELIQETPTTITLQLTSSQIEISKLSIKTIDGRSPFERRKPRPAVSSEILEKAEVRIPSGNFLMGDTRDKDALVHKVHLYAFWIDTREVTNAQYQAFVKATGHNNPRYRKDAKYNGTNQPVVGVSWDDAYAYCNWKGKRLPTEAEWERAARGPQSRLYPWGDRFDIARTNTRESRSRRPLEVGTFIEGATTEGLLDMSGNVWEWCQDWFDEEYYRISPVNNPTGPESGKKRVIRGGGWSAPEVHMARRRGEKQGKTYPSLGFRCARTDNETE